MQPNVIPTFLDSVTQGNGQPLVLVHGSASDRRTWAHQIEAFAEHFLVVSFSRRYHWPNQRIADGAAYSMADQVDDLELVLKSFGDTRVHVVGHSYGAYLALIVSIRSPGLVEKLVLAEPPIIPLITGFPPRPHRILQQLFARPRTVLPIIQFMAKGLVPASFAARNDKMEEAIEHIGKAILGNDAFNALSSARLKQVRDNYIKAELLGDRIMMPLHASELDTIKVPTMLVTGENSPRVWHRLADRLEELIPNTIRVDIPDSSHIMHEDNAPAYNQAVLAFLQS